MNIIRAIAAGALKRLEHFTRRRFSQRAVNIGRAEVLCVFGCGVTGAASEDQQIRERVSAQAVRAVQTRCRFSGSEQPGHICLRGFRLNPNTAHHVMARGSDFHRPFGNIHVGELAKLVIHARQFLFHVFRRLVRDVQIGAAVLGAAPFFRLGIDRARHYVARR